MQSCRYAFTINNYNDENIKALATLPCKYLCYSKEVAPTTGTHHLQGYVVFKSNQRLDAAAKKLPGAHVEIAKGTSAQNIEYCSKNSELVEFGEKPKTPKQIGADERQRWVDIIKHAKADTLEEHDPKVYFLHYRTALNLAAAHARPIAIEKTVSVFCGPTGTGKTRDAWSAAGPDAYPKDPRSKFWCGYSGQENVIIDEFRGGIDIAHLLRWCDRYPVIVEIKNSSTVLKAKNIWITSNLHPRAWYPDLDAATLDALCRRLNITEYTPDSVAPRYSGWTTNRYSQTPPP